MYYASLLSVSAVDDLCPYSLQPCTDLCAHLGCFPYIALHCQTCHGSVLLLALN